MAAGGYVVVSQKLADTLIADGFRKGGFRRGVDPLTALSGAANREHDSMVAVAHRGRRVAMMTTLLEAMTEFDRDQQGAIPGSGP